MGVEPRIYNQLLAIMRYEFSRRPLWVGQADWGVNLENHAT